LFPLYFGFSLFLPGGELSVTIFNAKRLNG
jgi:hypothetical protein